METLPVSALGDRREREKMKKIVFSFLLPFFLLFLVPGSASAESYSSDGWKTTFTTDRKLESNFDSATIDSLLKGLQPGDDISIQIDVRNEYGKDAEWYMKNEVIKSLETGAAKGGGYTYELSYDGPGGSNLLFSSKRVGGETAPSGYEGLKEATRNLTDYFFLDTIPTGKTGHVYLTVGLDGETQGNDYQTKIADLTMRFAVEVPGTKIVRTGDDSNYLPLWIGMIAGGLVLLYFVLDAITDRMYFGKKRAVR